MPLNVRGHQAHRASLADTAPLLGKTQTRSDAPDKPPATPPAKAALTPLPRPRTLTAAASEITGHAAVSPKRGGRIMEAIGKIRANQRKAKSAGVDCARKSFASKALGVAMAALGVAVVVSIAVATGGAAVAAAAAIAGVVFAVSVADAGCAYMNLKNAEALRDNNPLPYDLPGGASSIRNLAHRLYRAAGMSENKARVLAGITDGILRIGMGVTMAVCTMGVTTAAESFERVAPIVGAAVNLVQSLADLAHNRSTAKVYAEGSKDLEAEFSILRKEIRAVKKETGEWLEASGDSPQEAKRLASEIERLDQFETELGRFQHEIATDVAAVKEIVPSTTAGVAAAGPAFFPAAAMVASVLIPGLGMEPGRVSPMGGAAGPVERRDLNQAPAPALVNPHALT